MIKYRIDFTDEQIEVLKRLIQENQNKDLQEAFNTLREINVTTAKREATTTATKIRIDTAKKKIVNAINMLRLEDKNITEYAVAKKSGCSINTVKKYRDFIEKQ